MHELDETGKTCACGSRMCRRGEDVSEKLDNIPAKIIVFPAISSLGFAACRPGINMFLPPAALFFVFCFPGVGID